MSVRKVRSTTHSDLGGGGEMGALIRAHDWSTNALQLPDTWPASLLSSVRIMLDSYYAMYIAWGEDYIQLYNDRYRPILGTTKHPFALGSSARDTFAESWQLIEPLFERVMQGEAIGSEDWMLPLHRNGYLEACYFTYSYNPIRIENGTVGGILVIVTETTDRVLHDRRSETLRQLTTVSQEVSTHKAAFDSMLAVFKNNPADVPFALLYEVCDGQFDLAGKMGSSDFNSTAANAPTAKLLQQVCDTRNLGVIPDVEVNLGLFLTELSEPVTKAVALPITQLTHDEVVGVLVFGINPRRALDNLYTYFLTQVTEQFSVTLSRISAKQDLIASEIHISELRRAVAQKEQDAQATINYILESITDPFYALDREWRFVYANDNVLKLWGKRRKDLIGNIVWDVFPPVTSNLIKLHEMLNRAVSEQRSLAYEFYSDTPFNGSTHWWALNLYPTSQGIAVYFQDITARKESERLRERLELMLDNLNAGFFILDQDERYVYMNQDAGKLSVKALGLSRDQMLYRTLKESNPAIVNTRFYRELQQAIAHQTAAIFEVYVELLQMWVEYRIYPSRTDVAVFVSDVSQHKQEEAERIRLDTLLENERERLANIMATVPGVIWENEHIDDREEMKLVFISAYVETMFGYTVEEALHEPHFWMKIIHSDDRARTVDAFYKVRQSGGSGVVNFRALHKNGRVIDIQAIMTTVLRDDKPVGKRGVMMDVSERQRLINAQNRYATMLRRSNEELQQFAYVASHDLQEPLRMVMSYLQLIESRYVSQLDADAHEFIGYAVDGAKRMKALINDLLAYSRVEGGEKAFAEFDSQLALDKALANLALKLEDKMAVVTADHMPHIKADMMQITQLFQNLIANGLKFQKDQTPRIHIGVERKPTEWLFSVRDNGIGIASEYLDRIFIIFQRLHRKEEYPGTGIGLAICKKVVERHGGRIWVESVVGEGTTFYFTMPV